MNMNEKKEGLITSKDLPEHPEYIETISTPFLQTKLTRRKQSQRRRDLT